MSRHEEGEERKGRERDEGKERWRIEKQNKTNSHIKGQADRRQTNNTLKR